MFKNVKILDNYILSDLKPSQLIEKNILPLLKVMLNVEKKIETNVVIYTWVTNLIDKNFNGNVAKIRESVSKKLKYLNSNLALFKVNINVISTELDKSKFDFHDRLIITDYTIIDSGKGFNLIPWNSTYSTSQILSNSIFEKYTYNRLKGIEAMLEKYHKSNNLGEPSTLKFKSFYLCE